jgi:transcriptional regulator with XRE-family HTH domain
MTPPIRRRDTGRKPTSERLRELREAMDPEPSQTEIAAALGEGQMWVSRRERGKPEPTVDDAIRLAEALGYAADFLILGREHRQLLARLGEADPEIATLALRLVVALPYFDQTSLTVLTGLLQLAEEKASKRSAG